MPTGIAFALVDDHTRVALALQNLTHQMLVSQAELARDAPGGLSGQIARVDLAHGVRVLIGHQDGLRRIVIVAKRDLAPARPQALLDPLDHTMRVRKKMFSRSS